MFPTATVDVNILMFLRMTNQKKTLACVAKDNCLDNLSVFVSQNSTISIFDSDNSWTIMSSLEQRIKNKVEMAGVPLKDWDIKIFRGILTGYNEAFIITGRMKDELIASDPKSAEIIRPILRGRDIKRYRYEFANLWLIVTHNGNKEHNIPRVDIDTYPAIKTHLDSYYTNLVKRADKGDTPYNLRNCVYMDDFFLPKIVWGNLCLSAQFAFAEGGYFVNAPSTMIIPGNKYILAILNSQLADWYIRQLGVTRNGGYFEYKPMFVEKLPIPMIDYEDQAKYTEIVEDLLVCKNKGISTETHEKMIDRMVFSLYKLTDDEIEYIQNQ